MVFDESLPTIENPNFVTVMVMGVGVGVGVGVWWLWDSRGRKNQDTPTHTHMSFFLVLSFEAACDIRQRQPGRG
jgi:hypothetical protein